MGPGVGMGGSGRAGGQHSMRPGAATTALTFSGLK
jgi:hypothetical protein